MKYTTLFFDADDTLFDFSRAEERALKSFYEIHNLPVAYERFKKVYERENALLWKALEEGRATPEEVKTRRFTNTMKSLSIEGFRGEELSSSFIDELAKCDFLLPGAIEFLDALSGRFQMIIVTNGLWDVQRRRVGGAQIFGHFNGLIVSEKVGFAKPDGRFFDEAFKTAGFPDKKRTLMIGDSLSSDIKGGYLYGMDTCWFNRFQKELTGDIKPTWVVHSFEELKLLLLS